MTVKYDRFPSLRLYDLLGVPYVLTSEKWDGPLWTGHCMMLSLKNGYEDEGFAHELFHWLAATPKQRMFPDFALGQWVNSNDNQIFATSAAPVLWTPESRPKRRYADGRNVGWGEKTITVKEAEKQEEVACLAMWLYHPLVGLSGWDSPVWSDTASEFAGMQYPGSDEWNTSTATKRVEPLVAAIDPTVTRKQIKGYLNGLDTETE